MKQANFNPKCTKKVALITGSAKRIGASTAQCLHQSDFNVIIHCNTSIKAAQKLANTLNAQRPNSAHVLQADLNDEHIYTHLIEQAHNIWQRLDVLVNNASSFYPTPIGEITLVQWNDLITSNMKAPLFLSQASKSYLKETKGCIINMLDIHAQRPMKNHTVYCIAKAGLAMLTQSLAKELAPEIRVNGVAPGAILWPENAMTPSTQKLIIERIALKKAGEPNDIAKTILFLVKDAPYITGQIIAVDGGRLLNI